MSKNIQNLNLKNVNALSLSEVFSSVQAIDSFPFYVSFSATDLLVDEQCNVDVSASISSMNVEKPDTTNIELVVFNDIRIDKLQSLILQCNIKITALNAINTRNNLTSFRFLITVTNLNEARQALIKFTEEHTLEAAIMDDAPKFNEPGLLVMDMDSTTIKIECIDEIAILAGVGEEVSAVTELAMQGQLDFSGSLYQRVATLNGSSESILADVAKNIPLMEGLETLITLLKQQQWRIAIASGGFTYFADHLKDMLKLDAAYANTLEIIDGKLTGKVLGDVIDAQAKADCLLALSKQYAIPHGQTVAMGDGANDLVMMKAAHLGVAYHAKSIVKEKADTSISHSGLDCMVHWLA